MAYRRSSRDNLRGPPGPPPNIPLPPLPSIPDVSRHLPPLPTFPSAFSSRALPPPSPNMPPLDLSLSVGGSRGTSGSSRPTRSGDPQPEQSGLRRSSSQRLRRTSLSAAGLPSVLSAPPDRDDFRVPRPPTLSPATPSFLRSSSLSSGAPPSPRQSSLTGSSARTIRRRDNFELPSPTDLSHSRTPTDFPLTGNADLCSGMDELGLPPPEIFGLPAEGPASPERLPWLPEPLFAEERTAVRSMGACPPGYARCAGCKDIHPIEDLRSQLSMGPVYCNRCHSKLARERSSSYDLSGLPSRSQRTRRSSTSGSALPDLSSWPTVPHTAPSTSGLFGSVAPAGSTSFSDPFDMPIMPQRRSGTPTIDAGMGYRGAQSNISPVSTSTLYGMPPLSYSSGSGGSASRQPPQPSTSRSGGHFSLPAFDPDWAGGLSSSLGGSSHSMQMSPSSPSFGTLEGTGVQGHSPLRRRDPRRVSRISTGESRITDWLSGQQPFQSSSGSSSSPQSYSKTHRP